MSQTAKQFEKLTGDFLDKAAGVPCSQAEYRTGLRAAIEEIQSSISASEETDDGDDGDDDDEG